MTPFRRETVCEVQLHCDISGCQCLDDLDRQLADVEIASVSRSARKVYVAALYFTLIASQGRYGVVVECKNSPTLEWLFLVAA